MSYTLDKYFIIWSKSSGTYSSLISLLKSDGWQSYIAADLSLLAEFGSDDKKLVCLAILGPVGALRTEEVCSIKDFIFRGHKAIVANSASNREGPSSSNINDLVEPFGASFNEDCIIRPNPFKLYHPSEAMLENFVSNRGLLESLEKFIHEKQNDFEPIADLVESPDLAFSGVRIVYPQGCTLRIASRQFTVMMTSSQWALPSCQPICAFYRGQDNKSRMILLGSYALMTDDYVDKECNKALVQSFLEFLNKDDFQINISDARTLEVPENNMTADMDFLLNTPISAIQQLEAAPEDPSGLIDKRLFSVDSSKLPRVLRAYEKLNISNQPLTIMRPLVSWRPDGSIVRKDELKFLLRRDDGSIEMVQTTQ